MLLLACFIDTLLILLNCWWTELKVVLLQLGFLPIKWGGGKIYCIRYVHRHSSIPQEGIKHTLMRSGLEKSLFSRKPHLSSYCLENCLHSVHPHKFMLGDSPNSSGSEFPPSRSSFSGIYFLCISPLWPWLYCCSNFWNPYPVSFIKQYYLKWWQQRQSLLPCE